MLTNTYPYDEPLGLYGPESHERLAKGVISASVRYTEAVMTPETEKNAMEDISLPTTSLDEIHLGTLVESRDAHYGRALAVLLGEEAVIGAYCLVGRDGEPEIKTIKSLAIAQPSTYESNQDYKDEVEKLTLNFDKTELETILRILGKITIGQEIAQELSAFDRKAFKKLEVSAQRARIEAIRRDRETLKRLAAIEPFTLYALHTSDLTKQSLFPGKATPELDHEIDLSPQRQIEHISEWMEFIEAANDRIKRESDLGLAVLCVNVQYEVDNKRYHVKLIAEHGQLAAAQVLCEDHTGHWQSQFFEINSDGDEDGAGLNMVSQMWNRPAILSSLQHGETIDNETYEGNRLLAENNLRKAREAPTPVYIHGHIKRPAA